MHSILIKVETCIKKSISTVSCSLILNCPPPLVSCFEQEPTDILIIHTPNNPTNLTLPWVFTLSVLFKHVLMFVWSSFKEFCNYVSSSTITFSLLWQKEIVCFLFCFFQLCEHWMLIGSQHQTHHQCRCPLLSKRLLVFFPPLHRASNYQQLTITLNKLAIWRIKIGFTSTQMSSLFCSMQMLWAVLIFAEGSLPWFGYIWLC